MSDRIDEAEAALSAGEHKRALTLLWDEKTAAAARRDARRLGAVRELAQRIHDETRGSKKADAFLLAESAQQELRFLASRGAALAAPEPPPAARPAADVVQARLDELERKVEGLQREIADVRALAASELAWSADAEPASPVPSAPAASPSTRVPKPPPQPPAERPPVAPSPSPAPGRPRTRVPRFAASARPLASVRPITVSDLVGARALAWAGGVVTLLGIVFFFVLAVNRGWVSPELRCFLGAAVSAAVYGFGFFVRRRYGSLQAALAAAGAGIGGAYATLFAATALYDFLSQPAALAVAAGIAAVGVATALAWNTQTTAALGLVGAILGPVLIEDDPTVAGAAFVALVFAAAAGVTLRRDWVETMAAVGIAAGLEVANVFAERDTGEDWRAAALIGVFAGLYAATGAGQHASRAAHRGEPGARDVSAAAFLAASVLLVLGLVARLDPGSPVGVLVVVGAFWILYLALAVGYQLRWGGERLERVTATLGLASTATAFWAVHEWFDGRAVEGYALLVVAAVTLSPLPALRGRGERDLTSLLWATALTVAAVAGGYLLTGERLALVWAAQGALLSFLAVRVREARLQGAAAAYLGLALAYTLGYEAPPDALFQEDATPAGAIPSVLFVALGAAAFAFFVRRQPRLESRGAIRGFGLPSGRDAAVAGGVTAGALAVYAGSFGLLAVFQQALPDDMAGVAAAFERGHAAVTRSGRSSPSARSRSRSRDVGPKSTGRRRRSSARSCSRWPDSTSPRSATRTAHTRFSRPAASRSPRASSTA